MIEVLNFKKIKSHSLEKKQKKIFAITYNALFDGRWIVLHAFESKIVPVKIEATGFSNKALDHSNFKLLTPNQML